MTWAYRNLLRPLLFRQESERVHDQTLRRLSWAGRHPGVCNTLSALFSPPPLSINVFGLEFPNPVGLAAGMDKQAAALPVWSALGFGFTELGGVTWEPQPGNPSPRMFRLVEERALINRMGFNNSGARAMAERLEEYRKSNLWPQHPVGINLGKSKSTSLADAPADYSNSFRSLWSHADFFVVNVSSPNTPNLRQLQDKTALDEILAALQQVNEQQAAGINPAAKPKPILIKVAPDLSFSALDEILELIPARKVAGIVATNTTITRPSSCSPAMQKILNESGGLSGRPLAARSTEIVSHVYRQSSGKVPIIGVGGVFDSKDAWDKIAAGASLIQVYTGLVYEGPGIVKGIVTGLSKRLEERDFKKLSDAVGCSHRQTVG